MYYIKCYVEYIVYYIQPKLNIMFPLFYAHMGGIELQMLPQESQTSQLYLVQFG